MERTLTLVFTWVAFLPLFFLVGYGLVWWLTSNSIGGSDDRMANGYLSILAGLILVGVEFFLVLYIAGRYVQPNQLNYLKLVDGAVVGLSLVGWLMYSNYESRAIDPAIKTVTYTGYQLNLDLEVRIEKSLLAGARIDSLVRVRFMGGRTDTNVAQANAIRNDQTAVILPWKIIPLAANSWYIVLECGQKSMYFWLPSPNTLNSVRPVGNWSDWIKPTFANNGSPEPEGVAQGIRVRARYQLVPDQQVSNEKVKP
ncbi:hypothetical protein GCM10028805_04340 [Spirosoma harenae]